MKDSDYIEKALEDFNNVTQSPESYLNCEDLFTNDVKHRLKNLYDFLKTENILSPNALPELLINNFDTEQIWQQIELQNESMLHKSVTDVSRLLVNKGKLRFENIPHIIEDNVENNEKSELSDDNSDGQNKKPSKSDSESEGHVDSDTNYDDEEMNDTTVTANDIEKENENNLLQDMSDEDNQIKSSLDQDHLSKKLEDSDSESEVSVDLFKADSGDDEDDEEMKVKTARFKDFFRANDDSKEEKRNKFLQDMSDDEDDQIMSTLELRQERLNKKIEEIEETAVGEKPWTLKGEITGDSRPQNSLLEEVVEFDLTSRTAPVITEKTSQQLEDIIIQRIKDKLFDSVVRKEKPIETLLEYKKKLVLDQERSKHSLAQLYEKEYLDKQSGLDTDNVDKEEEPELHKEIKTMMNALFTKLDSLSNFHFTPKPSVPELKIVTNLPAIAMEEVAPVTVSDATLLAPEEVKNKTKGDILGKSERTKTDKKRERRKKKQKQQLHTKNIVTKNNNKKKNTKDLKVFNNKNIEKMVESLSSKTLKSSKAFFSHLEEQVQSQINSKQVENKKKNSAKSKIAAKKIKL